MALPLKLMPELPHPGQKVRCRDFRNAHRSGWVDLFGPGPFEVVRIVDKSDRGLAADLVVQTRLGGKVIPEVWLELADGEEIGGPGPTSNGSISLGVLP